MLDTLLTIKFGQLDWGDNYYLATRYISMCENKAHNVTRLCVQLFQMLDEALKDLMSSLNDQLSDYQTRNPSSESNKLELLVTTQ